MALGTEKINPRVILKEKLEDFCEKQEIKREKIKNYFQVPILGK